MNVSLPSSHLAYTDKYFTRSRLILEGERINPRICVQLFIRQGPGRLYGVNEAVEIIQTFAGTHDLRVEALEEGAEYASLEPIMRIEGPAQNIIELETMYLGVIACRTTQENDRLDPDLDVVRRKAQQVRELAPDKVIMYFGSRHWHWNRDAEISKAAIAGGFDSCATDIGAQAAGLERGVGTIPHALIIIFAHQYGKDKATALTTQAFDKHIDQSVARVALVDTFNREVDDAVATADALGQRLYGIRIDTAGENTAQGGQPQGAVYHAGTGVTVSAVRALRNALDDAGHQSVNIVLSSGFGDAEKLRAFVEAEKSGGRLFESLGVGGLFPTRMVTADIVRVDGRDMAKTGRQFMHNPRLRRVL